MELSKELQEHPSLLPQRSNRLELFEQKPQLHPLSGMSSQKGRGSEWVGGKTAITQGCAVLGGWPKLGTGMLWMGDTQDRVQEMAEMGLVCLLK